MNARNWARSRLRLAENARRCETEGHDYLDPDPITDRRHCRRCVYFAPGMRHVGFALNWYPERAETFNGQPNPEFPSVKANLQNRGILPCTPRSDSSQSN
jgi:hypothetical protein